MWPNAGRAHDFRHLNAMHHQRVGDQRAMTTPRHGFSAHEHDSLAVCAEPRDQSPFATPTGSIGNSVFLHIPLIAS